MTATLTLPTELTIYTAGELRPQWLAWLSALPGNAEAQADGSAIAEVDAAGLQLLLSLARALAQDGRTLRVQQPSASLQRACEGLALTALLETDSAQEATP